MKIVRFMLDDDLLCGVLHGEDRIAYRPDPELTVEKLLAGDAGAAAAFKAIADGGNDIREVALARVELLAPVASTPNNVFCVGLNYRDHVAESAQITTVADDIAAPTFFTKTAGTIAPPTGEIPLWTHVTQALDYEVELAVVIGKAGRDIRAADAMDHVFGYSIANDVSARDAQFRHGGQWFKGKSLDGSLPLGPWLVTRDEVADLAGLVLSLSVNGEERQRATVGEMIFDIPTLISNCRQA